MISMRRVLTYLLLSDLLLGQSFAVSAALCRHSSAREHALARESSDKTIAAGALSEETAASVLEKMAALSGMGALDLAMAYLPSASGLIEPSEFGQTLRWPMLAYSALEGEASKPLLRPPFN